MNDEMSPAVKLGLRLFGYYRFHHGQAVVRLENIRDDRQTVTVDNGIFARDLPIADFLRDFRPDPNAPTPEEEADE